MKILELTALRKLDTMKNRARPTPFRETFEAQKHQDWINHTHFVVDSNFAIAEAIMALAEKKA